MLMPTYGWYGAWSAGMYVLLLLLLLLLLNSYTKAYCQQDLSAFLTTNFVITPKIVIYCTTVWQYQQYQDNAHIYFSLLFYWAQLNNYMYGVSATIAKPASSCSTCCQDLLYNSNVDTRANSLKLLYSPSTRDRDGSWLSVTLFQTKLKKTIKLTR